MKKVIFLITMLFIGSNLCAAQLSITTINNSQANEANRVNYEKVDSKRYFLKKSTDSNEAYTQIGTSTDLEPGTYHLYAIFSINNINFFGSGVDGKKVPNTVVIEQGKTTNVILKMYSTGKKTIKTVISATTGINTTEKCYVRTIKDNPASDQEITISDDSFTASYWDWLPPREILCGGNLIGYFEYSGSYLDFTRNSTNEVSFKYYSQNLGIANQLATSNDEIINGIISESMETTETITISIETAGNYLLSVLVEENEVNVPIIINGTTSLISGQTINMTTGTFTIKYNWTNLPPGIVKKLSLTLQGADEEI